MLSLGPCLCFRWEWLGVYDSGAMAYWGRGWSLSGRLAFGSMWISPELFDVDDFSLIMFLDSGWLEA